MAPPLMHHSHMMRLLNVVGLFFASVGLLSAVPPASSDARDAVTSEYLRKLVRTRDEIAPFVAQAWEAGVRNQNLGWIYDRDLGWTHVDSVHPDGIDGTKAFYRYEPDGARVSINFRDRPCRIHAYGDSFTHCSQVNDGETWQEVLAAHLQEPLRNYGVGGYSVYQAYLRMRKVEAVVPAPYIILNIYDDDHYRNLEAWRSIRVGTRGPVGYPLPHLRVNVGEGMITEMPNPAQRAEDLLRLTDADDVLRTYADDPILAVVLVTRGLVAPSDETVDRIAASFGLAPNAVKADTPQERIRLLHAEAALYSSRRVLELVETYCRATNRKLLVVLSHGRNGMAETLSGKPRWDQTFLDYLKTRNYPYVDLREAHLADFAEFKGDVPTYIKRYYIGHYNPAGNFFCAKALKEPVVKWLDPRPLPYRLQD